jgi:hypothetical protein
MGLDLVVEGCARPGHEAEWRHLLERSFGENEPTEAERARFAEISIPAYERLGAPRVGFDSTADAWIIEVRKASTPEMVAAVLKDFHGYYALRLVKSDGVPAYSNGGLYDGIDETSFRGSFLSQCGDVVPKDMIDDAWGHKFPEAAIRYGRALLAAARSATPGGPVSKTPAPKRGPFSRPGLAKKAADAIPLEEQLKIIEAAGRWFVFWGERGHAIRAWF